MAKQTKETGTITEIRFQLACLEKGAVVLEPLGDYAPYDCVVQPDYNKAEFFRVQVKTAIKASKNSYKINTSRRLRRSGEKSAETVLYREDEIDFFATEINDCWYIIPFTDKPQLYVNPVSEEKNLDEYKDAWHLLKL